MNKRGSKKTVTACAWRRGAGRQVQYGIMDSARRIRRMLDSGSVRQRGATKIFRLRSQRVWSCTSAREVVDGGPARACRWHKSRGRARPADKAAAVIKRTRRKVKCSSSGPVKISRVVDESSSGPQREAVVGRRVAEAKRMATTDALRLRGVQGSGRGSSRTILIDV